MSIDYVLIGIFFRGTQQSVRTDVSKKSYESPIHLKKYGSTNLSGQDFKKIYKKIYQTDKFG